METLVLVHGFFGGSAQWVDQKAFFSEHFRVLTPDLPGFGANNHLEAPDRIEGFAEFVLQYVTDQGVDRFHLLGHSLGGFIAQEMVSKASKRINKLVLYGTGPAGLMPGRFESVFESKRRVLGDGAEATGRRIAATWFVNGEAADRYQICEKIAAQASTQAVMAVLSSVENWSGKANLPHIQSPTLVIWGDLDRSYLWSQTEQLWNEIPGAHLSVLSAGAHAVHLEKPDLFNAVLQDFLVVGNHQFRQG